MSQIRREERGRKSPSLRTLYLKSGCLCNYVYDETNGRRLEVMTYGIKIGTALPLRTDNIWYRKPYIDSPPEIESLTCLFFYYSKNENSQHFFFLLVEKKKRSQAELQSRTRKINMRLFFASSQHTPKNK